MATSKRIEIIRNLLAKAEEYLAKRDAIQSSEKLYKAAEECIKLLSERFNLPEVKEAEEKKKWTVTLLEKAVRKLSDKISIDVQIGWDAANYLHVFGFHEAKLEAENVKARIPLRKRLIELTLS
jgi:hypothetical protein